MNPDFIIKYLEIAERLEKAYVPVSLRRVSLYHYPQIERVIYNFKNPNKPATIVFWNDGTKTVVVCGEADHFDEEVGVAMCYIKKIHGNRNEFKRIVKSGEYQEANNGRS